MHFSPAPAFTSWPCPLEDTRIDDALAAAAYEATPAKHRAALKSGLALSHMYFGQSPGHTQATRRDTHLGFWQQEAREPAHWALVVFGPAYAAAARLAAACMPALLAGVPLLGAVCAGGPPRPETLVSLELCGVEDVFAADMPLLETTLRACPAREGRLVLLHEGELSALAGLARELHLPCFEEYRAPRLLLRDAAAFDTAALAFAHGSAPEPVSTAPHDGAPPPDALYAAAALPDCPASLLLTPGCEGFWLHLGLTPEFFTLTRRCFGPLPSAPCDLMR
ncbi:MAG: hypothetical protein Q4F27_03770 [Desulfovibrionaceae bacterium]|nr:hypothetical protein [Desulfovibrionaceae bacterium]